MEEQRSHWQHLTRAFDSRNFRLFFSGQSISLIGMWMHSLALSWLVWRLTRSSLWLGIIGFSGQIPILFLGLVGGAIADRIDRRRGYVMTQSFSMLIALLLAWLVISERIAIWHVVFLSTSLGIVYAFEHPMRQTFLMDMVGRRDLLNAVALNSAIFHITRMIGPIIAGFLITWYGEGICFLINGLSFIALIVALGMMRPQELRISIPSTNGIFPSIREGLRFASGSATIRRPLVLLATIAGAFFCFLPLMPIFADRIYGGGAVELGWLMGSSGVGACLGALTMAMRRHHQDLLGVATKATIIASLFLLAFSQTKVLWLGMAMIFAVGYSLNFVFTAVATHVQHESPDHLRGRMMSLYTTLFMGLMPISSIVGGTLASKIGAPLTLSLAAITCLSVGIGCFLFEKKLMGHQPVA